MALSCLQRLEAEPIRARRGAGLSRRHCLRDFTIFVVCGQLALFTAELRAQEHTPEYKTKAGFLKTFPDYTKWPAGEAESIKVGILGEDPFGGALDSLNPKRSKKIEELKDCQMIFISKSEADKIPAILSALEGANVLTVGETEGFAKQGGVIGFVKDDDMKTRFEINIGAARRAGLTFDLRLLRLVLHLLND